MHASSAPDSADRPIRIRGWVLLAVAVGVLAACGSSGGTSGAATSATDAAAATTSAASSTASTVASATTATAAAAATTAASSTGGSSDDSELAASLCDVIRATQAELPAGSVTAAYQTTFVLKAADALQIDELKAIATGRLDAPVKAACPKEYGDFLGQAGVAGLAGL